MQSVEWEPEEVTIPAAIEAELLRLTDGPEGAAPQTLVRCPALLDLLREALDLPSLNDDDAAALLNAALTRFIEVHRVRALKGFVVAHAGHKEVLSSAEHAASRTVTFFGELLDKSDGEALHHVIEVRKVPRRNLEQWKDLSLDRKEYVAGRRIRSLLWYWARGDYVLHEGHAARRARRELLKKFYDLLSAYLVGEATREELKADETVGQLLARTDSRENVAAESLDEVDGEEASLKVSASAKSAGTSLADKSSKTDDKPAAIPKQASETRESLQTSPAEQPGEEGSEKPIWPKAFTKARVARCLTWQFVSKVGLAMSFPLASILLPPPSIAVLQSMDEKLLGRNLSTPGNAIAVCVTLGLMLALVRFIVRILQYVEPANPPKGLRGSVAILTAITALSLFLSVTNIASRVVAYSADTRVASSIEGEIADWQPVILDNDDFGNYQDDCRKVANPTSDDWLGRVYTLAGQIHLNYIGSPPPKDASKEPFHNPIDRPISSKEYQCSAVQGALQTKLSIPEYDIVVLFTADGGKSAGADSYYIETEVRPMYGTGLASCLLATGQPDGESGKHATLYSVRSEAHGGRLQYVAKISRAYPGDRVRGGEPDKEDIVGYSNPLPFVQRLSIPGADYDTWTKLAVYHQKNETSFLVDDRVVATIEDSNRSRVFPQLGTRAGTERAGGSATCEFRYLRTYSPR